MKLSCVILTQADRPDGLDRAVGSALRQRGVEIEAVVVGNGADLPPLSHPVTPVRLPENAGIPGGRNRGVAACTGEIVLFLDDDGWYPSDRLAEHVRESFRADPRLGVISFRVQDPCGGSAARRHVPRLVAGDPRRTSAVTTFLGGACAVRRELFDRLGGLPEGFFYAHEETDFAWRVLDAGYHIRYDGDAVMNHPAVAPTRHPNFHRLNARNRVWLARRNLPWPAACAYLASWVVITAARERSRGALLTWFRGFVEGWREPCGRRRPISWRTAWVMTRAGRPPVV